MLFRSWTAACPGSPFSFNDLSTFTQGSVTGWQWNFGDGTGDTVQNTSHIFSNGLVHQVTLLATASNGCFDSTTITVNSLPVPVASFVPHSGCVNAPLQFTDASHVSNGSIVSATWDFDDNTALVTQSNPQHIYTQAGTYTVTLIATASSEIGRAHV